MSLSLSSSSSSIVEPNSKRSRHEDDSSPLHNVIHQEVFQDIDTIRNSYLHASPYPHGMIYDFFVDGFLGISTCFIKQNTDLHLRSF